MKGKGRLAWPCVLDDASIVQAAGGILIHGVGEVLLVHHKKHRMWGFPKGRLEVGEELLQCALREVLEETGIRCEPRDKIATVRYFDRNGRPKEVHFWRMTPATPGFTINDFVPNEEIDQIKWFSSKDAFGVLLHKTDRVLLKKAFAAPTPTPSG